MILCVSPPTFEEHLIHLRLIFERYREANITLKPSKCEFAKEEVEYLGHIASAKGVRPDPTKIN